MNRHWNTFHSAAGMLRRLVPSLGGNLSKDICLLLATTFCFWTLFLQTGYATQQGFREVQLKAVYLYNFFNFVSWPETEKAFGRNKTIKIGILGESPLNDEFELLKGKAGEKDNVSLEIFHYGPYKESTDYSTCHILYISSTEKENFKKIINGLHGTAILTVGDTEDFLPAGGMIRLVTKENRVRFQINRAAAAEAGLSLSSQLLKTAIEVR